MAEIEAAEKAKMLAKVEHILAHDINVFVNRQLIYNLPEQRFAHEKVMSIEHSDLHGTERLGTRRERRVQRERVERVG